MKKNLRIVLILLMMSLPGYSQPAYYVSPDGNDSNTGTIGNPFQTIQHGGLVIYHKKLENGSFKLPSFDENNTSFQVSWHDLMSIVSEVKIKKRRLQKKVKTT